MGRLIYYELLKQLKSRFVQAFLLLLLPISALLSIPDFAHFGVERDSLRFQNAYRVLEQTDREVFEHYLAKLQDTYGAAAFPENLLEYPERMQQLPRLLDGSEDGPTDAMIISVWRFTEAKQQEIRTAREKALRQAEALLQDAVEKKERYQIRRYEAILRDFREEITLKSSSVHGWDQLIRNRLLLFPACLFALFVSAGIFTSEKRRGTEKLLLTMKYGKDQVFLAKYLAALILSSVGCLAVIAGSIAAVYLDQGFSGGIEPVQLLETFLYCPFHLSVRGMAVLSMTLLIVTVMLFSVFVTSISALSAKDLIAFGISLPLAGLLFYFSFSRSSLKKWLLFAIPDSTYFLSSFEVVPVFGLPVLRLVVLITCWLLLAVIIAAAVHRSLRETY